MSIAPTTAKPLGEENSDYGDLEKGIWFVCSCGRIGHIKELLCVDEGDSTEMWCPKCKTVDWKWR